MNPGLRFLPGVEGDVLAADAWYEGKATGLGEEFLRIFFSAVQEIPHRAWLYPEVHGTIRRRLLIRFPYAIYYRVQEDEVVVYGVFHCARSPRNVGKILESRDE